MRNLKRVLSLSLASVMLLGMMVIGAGAKDYTDNDSISQKEAAQVMEAIGVMQGNDKGEFLPTADLTREAAAKIITYLLLGKTTADGLTTGKAPFDDVEAGRWSAGSIAYCSSQGIISGDGKGNFFPTETVTGTQFAKMLLGALGYKADVEGYVGPDYVQNIAKAVVSTKIHNGVDSSLSATLTREEAARMALNTLTANLVQYTGGMNVVTPDGTVVNNGGTRSFVLADDGKTPQKFMAVYQTSLKYKEGTSGAYGRPSHTWTLGKTEIGTYGNTVDVTFTTSNSKNKVKDALSGYSREAYGTPVKYPVVTINGAIAEEVNISDASGNDGLKAIAGLTGAGRLVEVYANGNYEITNIVVVDQVLAQISAVNTSAKDVRIVPVSFEGTLPGIKKGTTGAVDGGKVMIVKESDNKDAYAKLADMKVDDYALVTFDNGKVASVAAPDSFTGAYTAQASNGKRTIGGNVYDDSYAAKNFNVDPVKKMLDSQLEFGKDYLVYTDSYGNPLYAKADTTTSGKYGYVLDVDHEGSRVNNTLVYSAKVLFEDGTQEWVKVVNADKTASKDSDFGVKVTALKDNFVSYSVNVDGGYVMTTMTGARVDTFGTTGANGIKRGEINFLVKDSAAGTTDTGKTVQGNSKTVFLTGDGTYKAYTGIKNVPSLSNVSGKILYAAASGNVASMVFITTPGTLADKEYVYLLSGKHSTDYIDNQYVYTYDAVVNGKIGTIKTTTTTGGGDLDRGLYSIDKFSGDNASVLSPVSSNVDNKVVMGTVTVADGQKLVCKDGVVGVTDKNGAFVSSTTYMMADNFAVVGYDTGAKSAYGISAGQVKSYDAKSYILLLDSDGMAATLIFEY